MAEPNWRVNARGRKVPNRVTSNMRAFTGEKPVGGRDKARRRYNRKDGGTGRRASLTGSFNRSVRSKATAKNPGTGPTGGTRTSDVDRPSNVERRGKGRSPITSSRTRSVRVKQATDRRRTFGGDGLREFKTGKSPVTKGKGGYAGYRYVKPGSNDPIRQVKTPKYKKDQRRSGQGRTNLTRPNAADPKRTGPNRITGGSRTGKLISGAKSSSAGPNATGARRTGGGKTPMKGAGQPRTETKTVYKPKMNQKGKVKANTVLKGVVSLLSRRLNHAMTAADIWQLGKTNSALDQALKRIPDTSDRDAGRLLGNKIVSLATAAFNKKKTKRSVANLPSGYKQSEKKAFKEAKKWKRVNRKKR